MSDRRNDIQIGLFSIIGLLLLAMMILVFGGFKDFLADTYAVTAYFDNAAGTAEGTPVRLRGIEVGRVKTISLSKDRGGVVMMLAIKKNVDIEADAPLAIKQEGFIANIFLEFGTGSAPAALPKDGTAVIEGEVATFAAYVEKATTVVADMGSRMGERITSVSEGLEELIGNLNDITGDEEFRGNVKDLAANGNDVAAELKAKLPGLLDEFKATAAKATGSMEKAEELFSTYKELGEELRTTNVKVQAQVEKQGANLDELSDSLVTVSDNISELASNLNEIALAVKEGRGSVGRLITEDDLYRTVVDAIDTLAGAAKEFKELANTIKKHPDWILRGTPDDRR